MECQMCSRVFIVANNTACHKTTNLQAQMYVNKSLQSFKQNLAIMA